MMGPPPQPVPNQRRGDVQAVARALPNREKGKAMRIHTDATEGQVRATVRGLPVSFHTLEEHGSRTHRRSFELRLEGTGGRSNTGLYGAGDYSGATWDERGAVLSAIFAVDPNARMGGTATHPVYADAEDFHWQTAHRFYHGMPEDTHPRHQWEWDGTSAGGGYTVRHCRKCSALSRTVLRRELVSA